MMRRLGQCAVIVAVVAAAPAGEGAAAAACPSTAVRWASSSRILYVSGAVSCTLTDLDAFVSSDVLREVDGAGKVWLLRGRLYLQNGATLVVHGAAAGGDANELRLLSNDSSTSGSTIYIRAQWGRIDLDSTRVISWDEDAGGPDTRPSSHGRAYIHVRSYLDSGGTARESRMDIKDSEVGWLGYNASESYGLTWKVYGSGSSLYDKVDVLGDVTDSYVHHNYFGAYAYGAHGMSWLRNEIAHNAQYGLDPHDDSDHLTIRDNDVHDNGNHGIICSQRCNDLVIAGNHVYDNATHGIMLHRRVTDSVIEDNDVHDNGDAGIAVFDSSGNVIRNNRVARNKRGIRLSVGSSDNLFSGNEVEGSRQYALYFYRGSDAPTSGDGHPRGNTFIDNHIHDNAMAIKATSADENEFIDNTFADNDSGFQFVDCVGNVLSGNDIPATSRITTKTSSRSEATTIITGATRPLYVESEEDGVTRFVETSTWTHKVSGLNVATVVTPGEATLSLTSSHISSPRTVSAVKLYAAITGGNLRVTPSSWSTSTSGSKAWTARSGSGSVAAQFQVGQLAPGASYAVRRNGSAFTTRTANSAGVISFSDAVGTSTVTYSVQLP